MSKILFATVLALSATISTFVQAPVGNGGAFSSFSTGAYVNIREFGAVGDCKTDDGPAIIAAAVAAVARHNGNNVYFPPTKHCYLVRTPLVLPTANKWTTLYLDSAVELLAPIVMSDWYIIYGNSGDDPSSFSQSHETIVSTFMTGQQAAIQIHNKWAVRLEHLRLGTVPPGQDGILVDGTSGLVTIDHVTIDHVTSELTSDNVTGFPLHIKGGTLISVLGGVFGAPAANQGSSIEIETDPNTCALMGMVKISDTVMINHGVRVNLPYGCGVFAELMIDNVLYQDAVDPLLTTIGLHGSLSAAISLRNDTISDGTGNATCLANHGEAWSFQVYNCLTGNGQAITQGDIIQDLEIWSAGSQSVGQSSQYVYHGMNGVLSTMPTVNSPPSSSANSRPPINMNFTVPAKFRGAEGGWDR